MTWTHHVADAEHVHQAPLGPLPPGMLGWSTPADMLRSATALPPLAEVPRVKMWILAVLSAFVFWVRTPGATVVLPVGVLFAVWCWHATSEAFTSHQRAGSAAVSEIKAARWVAVGMTLISLLQVVMWTR